MATGARRGHASSKAEVVVEVQAAILGPGKRGGTGETKRRLTGFNQATGSSHVVCGPTMSPAGPAWPRVRVLRTQWTLTVALLASWRLWAMEDIRQCTWEVALTEYNKIGENLGSDRFLVQELVDTVGDVFHMLVDSTIDPDEKYLGFPYFLKINYSCKGEPSENLVRRGHLTGLKPLVLVTFQSPVNFYRWKIEQLQIQMEAAPFRNKGNWVRVLASECIKRLCPVHFHSNGSEYVIALTTGKNEGFVHLGTITDGRVSFKMFPRHWSVCEQIGVDRCSIPWAEFIAGDYYLLLLVETKYPNDQRDFLMVGYSIITNELKIHYRIPEFIPEARGMEFLMILGTESYTDTEMVPKGMFYNPYNNLLFIWGNFLLQSADLENFIYLADFPKEQSISYLVRSFSGDMAIVTETEEIWYLLEGSYQLYKLFPSKGWDVSLSLQMMQKSSLYATTKTMVTLFYDDGKLNQLVYLTDDQRVGRLVKWPVPVEKVLMYMQDNRYHLQRQGSHLMLSFTDLCPFKEMDLRNLPKPQRFTRQERYRARPPQILEASGFHSENSLAVYQGLVYYLLWLHSKYDKPYADPVHDPTWRWWKNKKHDEDYYFYLASNWRSVGGVHIDMESYEKIYDLEPDSQLPERIYLDKGMIYNFTVFMKALGNDLYLPLAPEVTYTQRSPVSVGVVLADPNCIEATVKPKVLINRNSVLFTITLKEKEFCYDQGISGHHLLKTSMSVKVLGSSGNCFQYTHHGPRMQGTLMLPVLIGCPPGKRLAFDITYTLKYNHQENKHYFDCMNADPEMPCFLYRDIFYPFFLIQDLVTGDSGSFQGSFVLKVVGGGPTLKSIRDYSKEEIYRYNSPQDKTESLIWTTDSKVTTKDMAFHVMSHRSSGIQWLCLKNSPCYDIIPESIFSPEFFFKVLVSNRGVDNSTYCNYQLTFLLHIHGLPLSASRAAFIVMVSASIFLGLVMLYVIFCLIWPLMVKAGNVLRFKINNILASESYYSYGSSSRSYTTPSQGSGPSPAAAQAKAKR
nr:cation channel sperm-associated protein subunit gamma isoform X5 [Microcebus murinus]